MLNKKEIHLDNKEETRKWLKTVDWDVAGTLTYKKGTCEQRAESIMRNFWGRANQALYGHAWIRFEKRIENVTILDFNEYGDNPHYHICIKMPADRYDDIEEFCRFLRQKWKKVCGANYISEFEAIKDKEGWVNYTTRKLDEGNENYLHTHSSHIAAKRS